MTGIWKWLLAGGLAASLALAAACGGDDDDNGEDGDSTPAATQAASTEPAGSSTETSFEETTYPLTITDMLGRSVTINAEPQAIAAISPTTVEFVYAVGETSLTRTASVTYPPEASSATDIGSAYRPAVELIAAAEPDLIVADSVLQPQLAGQLEPLGVPVLYIGSNNYEEVLIAYGIIGEALNTSEGVTQADALDAQLSEITEQLPGEQPKIVIVNGTPADFFVALPESYVGDLARLVGADNLAAGQPSNAPFPGYAKLSIEEIIAEQPEVILAITAAPGQTLSEALSSDPAWATVPAVANGRVHEIDAQIFLQAPGPRASEGLQTLSELLYPEIFGQ
jgi:iron complex transport system substrate-binding protein